MEKEGSDKGRMQEFENYRNSAGSLNLVWNVNVAQRILT
jgi:hypothetical protein